MPDTEPAAPERPANPAVFYRGRLARVLLVLALAAGSGTVQPAEPAAGEDTPVPVLVELFTSQGCSSCPPADDLLRTLERNQPVAGALVIPLSEHVDYWNQLGWRDPFSSRRFSERQRKYAESLGIDALYTPMMVVDGKAAIIGSRPIAAREAVVEARRAPKARLDVTARLTGDGTEASLRGAIRDLPPAAAQAELWVAVAESGLRTDVTRGENASRTLTHTSVVRSLDWLGSLPREPVSAWPVDAQVRLRTDWQREHLRLVVFVQAGHGGPILGVAALRLQKS